jgi:deoxyribose-phosphate aldolase
MDIDWVRSARANPAAVAVRAARVLALSPSPPSAHPDWLLGAVRCLDLTTLSGADTPGRVRRLAAKARHPVRSDVLNALSSRGLAASDLTVGAACVYHEMVAPAVAALEGSGVPVCAVSAGFPAGQTPLDARLIEIERSVAAGADEIDIVIGRGLAITGRWDELYRQVRMYRDACGQARMKAIVAAGDLASLNQIAMATRTCMLAGADFVKTSTGAEPVNAALPFGLVMAGAIRDYRVRFGHSVGLKPAGGISTSQQVVSWITLVLEELGPRWLAPDLFRIGASSALTSIEVALETAARGRESVARRQPLG